jgi:hypothetical protein
LDVMLKLKKTKNNIVVNNKIRQLTEVINTET